MKSTKHLGAALTSALLVAMSVPTAQAKSDSVLFSSTPPVIDGVANDAAWKGGDWHEMTSLMWGSAPESGDFSGRYKLRWNKDALYLLAEIQDDHLSDTYANPLERYWDDDCLEIFGYTDLMVDGAPLPHQPDTIIRWLIDRLRS